MEGLGWSRDDTWKPNSASFLKSKRDAASATMFSSNGIQNAINSISKTAATRRIDCRGLITGPLIERLLIASMIAVLSEAIRTRPFVHNSCQRRKAWSIANISLKLICFDRCRVGMRSENKHLLYIPPMPFNPLTSVAMS